MSVADILRKIAPHLVDEWVECKCSNTEIRLRTQSNGVEVYTVQCLNCGRAIKNVKKSEHPRPKYWFDASIQNNYEIRRKAHWEDRKAAKRDWYQGYLASPQWHTKRQLVIRRANGVCEGCGTNRATQVHHTTYEHVGDEFLWELRAVCDDCHSRIHNK